MPLATSHNQDQIDPQMKARKVVEECADCDIGRFLMDKIKELNPDYIVTDCLSCLLQFNQVLPYTVLHPIEILKQ